MHVTKDLDSWKLILEARIERKLPYTCLRLLGRSMRCCLVSLSLWPSGCFSHPSVFWILSSS
jgi:hypothetical protein